MPPCATDRPVGTEFPNHLALGKPACAGGRQRGQSPGEACRPLLLLGLMLLCLAPRALMAWKLGGVCPDGVAYIRLAELLDQGQGREFLRLAGVNPLPLALVALHRLGLDWEVAGSLWGVLMGAAVVLPLFGWLRRQFDRRVALAGCFLYAVHGELIRWSPEVLRDPTFWFLFTLGLYLLWGAVTEVRLGLFLSAAAVIVLASATRFEGLLLLVPLAGWSVARWRALRQGATSVPGATAGLSSSAGYTAGQANRADVTAGQASSGTRARLAIGALACLGAVPAVAVAALLLLGIRGHGAAELLHVRPLILAGGWLQSLAAPLWGDTSGSSPMLPKSLPPISFGRMWEIYVPTVVKGLTVLWTALWAVGAASRRWTHAPRFLWRRSDHLPLVIAQALLLAAMWVHLWAQHSSCRRYVFPAVLMGSGLAALGLLRVSALAAEYWRWVARVVPGTRRVPLLRTQRVRGTFAAAPAIVVGVVSLAAAFSWNCSPRTAKVELGRWLREQPGPAPVLFGPDGFTQVVNYYARGRCLSFSPTSDEETVRMLFAKCRPNVALLPRDESPGCDRLVVRLVEAAGLRPLDRGRLPASCAGVSVWMLDRPAGGLGTVPIFVAEGRENGTVPFAHLDAEGVDRVPRPQGP